MEATCFACQLTFILGGAISMRFLARCARRSVSFNLSTKIVSSCSLWETCLVQTVSRFHLIDAICVRTNCSRYFDRPSPRCVRSGRHECGCCRDQHWHQSGFQNQDQRRRELRHPAITGGNIRAYRRGGRFPTLCSAQHRIERCADADRSMPIWKSVRSSRRSKLLPT